MFPSQFEYHRPTSVQEAVRLLAADADAKALAGGHSLLPAMKLRLAAPSALVDLGWIDGLRGISVDGGVRIGAMTTYVELLDSAELGQRFPIIADAVSIIGDPQVRNRGTLGGSLAHADPGADLPAVILALGGQVKTVGSGGERTISADDLFVDLLTTSLTADELITEITIPAVSGRVGSAYAKHAHPASGYAVVGVAAVVGLDAQGICKSARIAVTGATSKATRTAAAEQALIDKPLNTQTIADAASAAAYGLDVNGDIYASADYRRHLVGVMTRRALEQAASRAGA